MKTSIIVTDSNIYVGNSIVYAVSQRCDGMQMEDVLVGANNQLSREQVLEAAGYPDNEEFVTTVAEYHATGNECEYDLCAFLHNSDYYNSIVHDTRYDHLCDYIRTEFNINKYGALVNKVWYGYKNDIDGGAPYRVTGANGALMDAADGNDCDTPTAIAGVAPTQHDMDIERVHCAYRATVKAKVVIIDKTVNVVNAVVIKGYFAAKLCECVNYSGLATLNKGKWYAKHVIAKMDLDDSGIRYREFIDGHLRGLAFNEITGERYDVLIDPMCDDYIH